MTETNHPPGAASGGAYARNLGIYSGGPVGWRRTRREASGERRSDDGGAMQRSAHHAVWAFVITGTTTFMVSLDNLVVTMALPAIREGLGANLEGLEWTVNAYTMTFAVFLLP